MCETKQPEKKPILVTPDYIVEALNRYVKVVQTTLRGVSKKTTNVILHMRWARDDTKIFLESYAMYRPGMSDVYVHGAPFVTDPTRLSPLAHMTPKDVVDAVAFGLESIIGLEDLYKYVKLVISSDSLVIEQVYVSIVRAG